MRYLSFSLSLMPMKNNLTVRLYLLPQKAGYASLDADVKGTDMKPLFDTILSHIPAPEGDSEAPLQTLISTIDYNEYVGRIGIGKVSNGTIRVMVRLCL